MGARSRRKGARFEREVAALLTEASGLPCARNLTECRDGNTGYVHGLPGFTIQCKVGRRPDDVYRAVREASQAACSGQHPVAIVRRNGSGSRPADDLAVLPLSSFLALLRSLPHDPPTWRLH